MANIVLNTAARAVSFKAMRVPCRVGYGAKEGIYGTIGWCYTSYTSIKIVSVSMLVKCVIEFLMTGLLLQRSLPSIIVNHKDSSLSCIL